MYCFLLYLRFTGFSLFSLFRIDVSRMVPFCIGWFFLACCGFILRFRCCFDCFVLGFPLRFIVFLLIGYWILDIASVLGFRFWSLFVVGLCVWVVVVCVCFCWFLRLDVFFDIGYCFLCLFVLVFWTRFWGFLFVFVLDFAFVCLCCLLDLLLDALDVFLLFCFDIGYCFCRCFSYCLCWYWILFLSLLFVIVCWTLCFLLLFFGRCVFMQRFVSWTIFKLLDEN